MLRSLVINNLKKGKFADFLERLKKESLDWKLLNTPLRIY